MTYEDEGIVVFGAFMAIIAGVLLGFQIGGFGGAILFAVAGLILVAAFKELAYVFGALVPIIGFFYLVTALWS